ncbi:MAG: DUF4276 family protein [Thiomargarita sp.]|nr:DUF4276 family protein [Thiomargarita sp.]
MKGLIFLVEEQSMKAALDELVPRLLKQEQLSHEFYHQVLPHQGKTHLQDSIKNTLQHWGIPDSHFIILQDKDSADCCFLKQKIATLCMEAGHPNTLIRIPCHELESWFLGDLIAIDKVFGTHLQKHQNTRKFRNPDKLGNAKEELKKYVHIYQQISGAREIAKEMSLTNNRSHSFQVFISGLITLLSTV